MASLSGLAVPTTHETALRPLYEAKARSWDAFVRFTATGAPVDPAARTQYEIERDRLYAAWSGAVIALGRARDAAAA